MPDPTIHTADHDRKSRGEVLGALEKSNTLLRPYRTQRTEAYRNMTEIFFGLAEIPNAWPRPIPVSERLPTWREGDLSYCIADTFGSFLCFGTTKNLSNPIWRQSIYCPPGHGPWIGFMPGGLVSGFYSYGELVEASHWLPLPPAPE